MSILRKHRFLGSMIASAQSGEGQSIQIPTKFEACPVGWRAALKVILCLGNEASPVTTLPANDIYWGYWGNPTLVALGKVLQEVCSCPI